MDTVALRDSWGKVVAAGDDTRGTSIRTCSRAVSDPDVGAARQAGGRLKADVSNLDELDNVVPSLSNRVVTTVASRCE